MSNLAPPQTHQFCLLLRPRWRTTCGRLSARQYLPNKIYIFVLEKLGFHLLVSRSRSAKNVGPHHGTVCMYVDGEDMFFRCTSILWLQPFLCVRLFLLSFRCCHRLYRQAKWMSCKPQGKKICIWTKTIAPGPHAARVCVWWKIVSKDYIPFGRHIGEVSEFLSADGWYTRKWTYVAGCRNLQSLSCQKASDIKNNSTDSSLSLRFRRALVL